MKIRHSRRYPRKEDADILLELMQKKADPFGKRGFGKRKTKDVGMLLGQKRKVFYAASFAFQKSVKPVAKCTFIQTKQTFVFIISKSIWRSRDCPQLHLRFSSPFDEINFCLFDSMSSFYAV